MKFFLLLFISLSVSFLSQGQMQIKVKGGIIISHLDRPPAFNIAPGNQVSKIGFQAGGVLEIPIINSLTFQAELQYSLKGLRDTTYIYSNVPTGNGFPYYRGYGYNFHYLELPLILKLPFYNGFKLGFGPSIGYLLRTDKVLDGKIRKDAKTNLSKMDYALNGDLSFTYKFLELGARYTHSLSSVQDLGNADLEFFQSAKDIGKNRSMQLYLSFRILP